MTPQKICMNWESPGQALVTGHPLELAKNLLKYFAKQGFNLVFVARRREKLETLAALLEKDYNIKCEILAVDLVTDDGVSQVVEYIKNTDNLDVLVNNAGFGTLGLYLNVPIEKSLEMLHVHVVAAMALCNAALPGMLQRGRGAIINVASMNAFFALPGNNVYQSTKSFLVAFTQGLALEYGPSGIKFQALCPGFTVTEFHNVGDFSTFNRKSIPQYLWMNADEVVKISLRMLPKMEVIVIPAFKNHFYKWVMLHTPRGRKFQDAFFLGRIPNKTDSNQTEPE